MLRSLLAIICLLACDSAAAQAPVGVATIDVRLAEEGLRAEVRLSRAVTEFAFVQGDVVRDSDFTMLTEGLTITGDTVSATRPFRRFEVLVRPATRERDAKYPAFFRVGDGGVLFAPALTPDSRWRRRLHINVGRGQVIIPRNGPSEHGSVYIGPRANVVEIDRALIIAPASTPVELRDAAVSEMLGAMRFYERELGVALPTPPVMAMTRTSDGSGHQGDVTPGPFVSLRFYGSSWAAPTVQTRGALSRFMSHEVFHFWNGSLANPRESTPSWLHEGGADYAALLSARDAGALDEPGIRTALGEALTRCRANLVLFGDVGMNDFEFLGQGVRYPCGIVIQWASDLALRASSSGEHNVFDAWAHTINLALAREDKSYSLADFTNYSGMETAAGVVTLLTETSGGARWDAIVGALRSLGMAIEVRPSEETRRNALLMHVLKQSCPNSGYGFQFDQDRILLDDVAACGVLAGGPVLTSIEDGDAFAVDAETYARSQSACAAGRDLAVVLDGSRRVSVPCRAPLADAQDAYFVTAG